MCLLTYFPPGAAIDAEALTCGAECNPHGHGFAVITPMGIVVEKSLTDPTGLIARFMEVREQFPDTDALFHSRITTHGETSLDNCHPFYVAGMGDTVLAHNGVLPTECAPRKGDTRSDTRVLADSYMRAQFVALDKDRTRTRMEAWLGRGSKVLVLTTNPAYRKSAYLFNSQLGEWRKGVWYSNDSYMPYSYWGSHVSYGKGTSGHVIGSYGRESWWESIDTDGRSGTYYRSGVEGYAADPWSIPRSERLFTDRLCSECGAIGQVNRFMYLCEWCWACWVCGDSADRPCKCERRTEGAPTFVDVTARVMFREELDDSGLLPEPPMPEFVNVSDAARSASSALSDTATKLIALKALTAGAPDACTDGCCPTEGV
jgi:glutamine amidotransferase